MSKRHKYESSGDRKAREKEEERKGSSEGSDRWRHGASDPVRDRHLL